MQEDIFTIRPVKQEDITAAYADASSFLRHLLPAEAEIHHVGSTSIPGSITKGDVDICVRVPPFLFALCDQELAKHYPRNNGSPHTDAFASFSKGNMGIQLVVAGSDLDVFLAFRDMLAANPALLAQYNTLKQACEGDPVPVYREKKAAFIESLLCRKS
jgi:GrpB-like predicted nucleotidyltransferase (UPF0157 family)